MAFLLSGFDKQKPLQQAQDFTPIKKNGTVLENKLDTLFAMFFLPAVRADLQSARIEYQHLQCEKRCYRIKNPNIQGGRIANPPERCNDCT